MDLEGAESPAPREGIKHRGPGRDPGQMPAPEDVSSSAHQSTSNSEGGKCRGTHRGERQPFRKEQLALLLSP